MVFQHFNLFPHRTVLDNVTLAPRKLKRLGAEEARKLGLAQLERVGLRHKPMCDRPPSPAVSSNASPSRAHCAMAPQVMFFDEATSRSTRTVVFMDHGQVVESGTPEQVFETAETDRLRRFLSQVL